MTGSVGPRGAPGSGRQRPDLGAAVGPSEGRRGPKEKEKHRHGATRSQRPAPQKFNIGGWAASGEPGEAPGRAIKMAGPGTRRRAAAERVPRSARPPPSGHPKAPTRGRCGPPRQESKGEFHSGPDDDGGLPGCTGTAPRREDEDGKVLVGRGEEEVGVLREPPWVRSAVRRASQGFHARGARCPPTSEPRSSTRRPLRVSTHGQRHAVRRQSPGLRPLASSGFTRTGGRGRPTSEPRSQADLFVRKMATSVKT